MKRFITFITLTLCVLMASAQQAAFLSIINSHNENFWVNINSYPINEQSTESITITNLAVNHTYNVEIVFNNPQYNTVSATLQLQPGYNNFQISYYDQNKMGTFEPTRRTIQAMMIVAASNTVQLSTPESGQLANNTNYNGQNGQPRPNFPPNPNNPNYPNNPNHPGQPNNPGHPNHPNTPTPPTPNTPPAPGNPGNPITPNPQTPPAPPALQPYSEQEFTIALQTVENQAFENDKLMVAKQVASSRPILTSQIVRLTKLLTFDKDRLDFLKYAYGFCYDKSNYYVTYNLLTFSSDKKELKSYISAHSH